MSCIKGLWRTNINLKRKLNDRDLAGYVICKYIKSVMNAEQFECFGLGRTKIQDDILTHLFCKSLLGLLSLSEDNDFKDAIIIWKIAAQVHQTLHFVPQLNLHFDLTHFRSESDTPKIKKYVATTVGV